VQILVEIFILADRHRTWATPSNSEAWKADETEEGDNG